MQAVNHIAVEMKLVVGEKEWLLKPILTCDLKALMKMLGLYDVFHPRATSKCPFCSCSSRYGC
jgi:hypothetical protein